MASVPAHEPNDGPPGFPYFRHSVARYHRTIDAGTFRKDLELIVEVADASRDYDRQIKGPLYARDRIPVYWLVNVVDSRIEVYADPKAGKSSAYRRRQDYGVDQSVPLVLGNRVVAHLPVRELLP